MLVFLFTDIEGSTRLWDEHTKEMGDCISRHDAILAVGPGIGLGPDDYGERSEQRGT